MDTQETAGKTAEITSIVVQTPDIAQLVQDYILGEHGYISLKEELQEVWGYIQTNNQEKKFNEAIRKIDSMNRSMDKSNESFWFRVAMGTNYITMAILSDERLLLTE